MLEGVPNNRYNYRLPKFGPIYLPLFMNERGSLRFFPGKPMFRIYAILVYNHY